MESDNSLGLLDRGERFGDRGVVRPLQLAQSNIRNTIFGAAEEGIRIIFRDDSFSHIAMAVPGPFR